nr:hypothetical protein [Tanacetum cinerariifolium]
LNYLEELSFHRIEKMKERLINDWMIIQRDFDELKTELEKVHSQISRLQKKPSELILSTQLRTVGMLETFPRVEDVDYITQDLAGLCVRFVTRVMSSPNRPTSDIKDAFFFNSPDYTLASPDYFSASLRNTASDSSNNSYSLVPIASPTLSLFHDDPYTNVMHEYDTIMPPQVPIPPLIIVPPSLMLSPIFNPQEFFVPEELLQPKEQIFKIGKSSIKMHLKHHEKQIEDILNYLEELSFHRIEKMEERLIND